jgi:hypothetical protein
MNIPWLSHLDLLIAGCAGFGFQTRRSYMKIRSFSYYQRIRNNHSDIVIQGIRVILTPGIQIPEDTANISFPRAEPAKCDPKSLLNFWEIWMNEEGSRIEQVL